jgi:hypothetical protein
MLGTLYNPNKNPKPITKCNLFPVAVEWLNFVVDIHKGKAPIIRSDTGHSLLQSLIEE